MCRWSCKKMAGNVVLISKFIFPLLALLVTPDNAEADGPLQCKSRSWNFSNQTCPADDKPFKELYMDRFGDQSQALCCDETNSDFAHQQRLAKGCRVSTCTSGGSGNLCSAFHDRYVNGVKLVYEEILRESCTKPSGATGVLAYCCPKDSLEGQLVTEAGAEENEFPHMAKFLTPSHCGGTVYSKKYVLTAGHCPISTTTRKLRDVKQMKVILGSNLGSMDSPEYTYGVKRVIYHPEYSRLLKDEVSKGRIYNDVAILELDREIKFSDKVKPLKLADEGFRPMKYQDKALAMGYGLTDTEEYSIHLQKSSVVLRKDEDCFGIRTDGKSWSYTGYEDLKPQLVCAGGTLNGVASSMLTPGDSGGGLVCRDAKGQAVLCGIASFSGNATACRIYKNEPNCNPAGFADISYFRQWIIDKIGAQDESTLFRPFLFGEPVAWTSYPHQVHITSTTGKSCGGTLIKQNMVITAGQCVFKSDDSKQGHSGIKVTTQTGQSIGIEKVAALPGFKRVGAPVNTKKQGDRVLMTDNYFKNDLALLKLKEKVNIPPAKLAQLPESEDIPEAAIEVSRLRPAKGKDVDEKSLMRREYKILDHADCQTRMNRLERLRLDVKVDKNVMCGVEKFSGGSLCDRELGGGLLCKGKGGKDVLCGVQMFRLCELAIPNGFMNMGMYRDWVQKAMAQLE